MTKNRTGTYRESRSCLIGVLLWLFRTSSDQNLETEGPTELSKLADHELVVLTVSLFLIELYWEESEEDQKQREQIRGNCRNQKEEDGRYLDMAHFLLLPHRSCRNHRLSGPNSIPNSQFFVINLKFLYFLYLLILIHLKPFCFWIVCDLVRIRVLCSFYNDCKKTKVQFWVIQCLQVRIGI